MKFVWNAIEGRKKISKAWPTKAKKKHSGARLKIQPDTRAPTRVATNFANHSFQKKKKKKSSQKNNTKIRIGSLPVRGTGKKGSLPVRGTGKNDSLPVRRTTFSRKAPGVTNVCGESTDN